MATTRMNWMLVLGTAAALCGACGGDPADYAEDPAASSDSEILGSDACKNTRIEITNSFELSSIGRRIRVLKVEYYSVSEGKYYTEDLSNQEISYGWTHTWSSEDLEHAENDLISKFKIHFNYKEDDGDWSDEQTQIDDITNTTCVANKHFNLTVD